ncbi:hypothetical protein ACHWQZ_G017168 [Mnemiopsis leidyi]
MLNARQQVFFEFLLLLSDLRLRICWEEIFYLVLILHVCDNIDSIYKTSKYFTDSCAVMIAPKVNVPMNFGKHLRDSPTHNTLKLHTSKGGEVFVSSVILSFNSPVIDHMTTTLHVTSVDMVEFSKAAVQMFVDAAYSGTAEGITREIFRDINKISHVFEMSWLEGKCVEYFTHLVESVKQPSYRELKFLLEEAGYVSRHLKKQNLLTLAIEKIENLGYKQEYLKKYLKDAEKLSINELDIVIKLAGSDVHIIVQSVVDQLTELFKVQTPTLSTSLRYLLDNSSLSLCRRTDKDLFEKLFDLLSSLPDDFLRWTFELHRKSKTEDMTEPASNSKKSPATVKETPDAVKETPAAVKKLPANANPTLQHLGHNFDFEMTLEDLMRWISSSKDVTSLLMAVEAIATWRQYRIEDIPILRPIVLNKLNSRLKELATKRGWSILPQQLRGCRFNFIHKRNGEYNKIDSFSLTNLCESSEEKHNHCVIVNSVNDCKTPLDLLFAANKKLVFHFEHPAVSKCDQLSLCGFILETVYNDNHYRLYKEVRLCTDTKEYIKEDMHLHEDVIRVDKMHLCLYKSDPYHRPNKILIPLSWLGWKWTYRSHYNQYHCHDYRWIREKWNEPGRFMVLYDTTPLP